MSRAATGGGAAKPFAQLPPTLLAAAVCRPAPATFHHCQATKSDGVRPPAGPQGQGSALPFERL